MMPTRGAVPARGTTGARYRSWGWAHSRAEPAPIGPRSHKGAAGPSAFRHTVATRTWHRSCLRGPRRAGSRLLGVGLAGFVRAVGLACPFLEALEDAAHRVLGLVGHRQEIEILRGDRALRQGAVAHPVEQRRPVRRAEEDDGEVQ